MTKKQQYQEASHQNCSSGHRVTMNSRYMITGSIVVYNRDNINHRTVYVKSKWFDDCLYYSFIDNGDFLKISKLRHETTKKAMKIVNKKFGFLSDLPIGEFSIDEDDSNEDVIYIYYKEQLNNV